MRIILSILFLQLCIFSQSIASVKDSSKSNNLFIYFSSGVFSSSSKEIKETFTENIFLSPVIGISFNDDFTPFVEYSFVRGKIDTFVDEKKDISFRQNFVSVGLMNKTRISPKLVFNVKYGFSTLFMSQENLHLPSSKLGFIAGGGFESQLNERLSINIAASYIYQSNNAGGFRFEPGIQIKL